MARSKDKAEGKAKGKGGKGDPDHHQEICQQAAL